MALQVAVGQIQFAHATASPQAITGIGFTPKAVMFFGYNGFAGPQCNLIGFDDAITHVGATANGGLLLGSLNEVETMTSTQSSIVICQNSGSELSAKQAEGYISSMDADGFTVTWRYIRHTFTVTIGYLAIGGAGVNATVNYFSPLSGSNTITGLGYPPKSVLSFFSNLSSTGGVTLSSAVGGNQTFGVCTECDSQSRLLQAEDSTTSFSPTQSDTLQISTASMIGSTPGTGVVTVDADGFTVTWTGAVSTAFWFGYLALGGTMATNVGTITQPGSTGLQTTSILGLTPKAVLLWSSGKVQSLSSQPDFLFSIGVATDTTQQAFWTGYLDGKPLAWSWNLLSSSACLLFGIPTGSFSGDMTGTAAFSAFGESSFTLDWTKVDGVNKEIYYIAFVDTTVESICGEGHPLLCVPSSPTVPAVVTSPVATSGSAVSGDNGVIVN